MQSTQSDICVELEIHVKSLIITAIAYEKVLNLDTDVQNQPHNHNQYELRIFQGNAAFISAGETEYIASGGDIFITPPLMYHFYRCVEREPFRFWSIRFSIKNNGETPSSQTKAVLSLLSYPILIHDDEGWILILMQKLEKEFQTFMPGYMSRAKALLTSLMLAVLEKLSPSGSLRFDDECTAYEIQRESLIEKFFINNYSKNITINDLAKELSLSKRQVNRVLNNLYSCSFNRKLLELRLEYAKLMLLHTTNRICNIAAQCGFNSLNYFHTIFSKTMGCSPLKYRQNRMHKSIVLSAEHFINNCKNID